MAGKRGNCLSRAWIIFVIDWWYSMSWWVEAKVHESAERSVVRSQLQYWSAKKSLRSTKDGCMESTLFWSQNSNHRPMCVEYPFRVGKVSDVARVFWTSAENFSFWSLLRRARQNRVSGCGVEGVELFCPMVGTVLREREAAPVPGWGGGALHWTNFDCTTEGKLTLWCSGLWWCGGDTCGWDWKAGIGKSDNWSMAPRNSRLLNSKGREWN